VRAAGRRGLRRGRRRRGGGPLSRARRQRLPGPGERGRGLAERQGGEVLRVQPPLGGRAGAPPQEGPGEGVLCLVEGGAEGDASFSRARSADCVEERGDGFVDGGDGGALAIESVRPGSTAHTAVGRRQHEPQREQPPRPREEVQGPLPPWLGQRHPGPDGGGDEQLRTGGRRDGPDGAEGPGDEPEDAESQGQQIGPPARATDVRPEDQTAGAGERGRPEPPHGDASAPRPVIDPGEHGAEGGDHPHGDPPGDHAHAQQRPRGQRTPQHGVPRHGPTLRTQGMAEPRRKRSCARGHRAHRVPVVVGTGTCRRTTSAWACDQR
jgi:hypothetical protein